MQRLLFITGTGLILVGLILRLVLLLTSPLRKVPGPAVARFTNLWFLWRVSKGQSHYEAVELRRKYGMRLPVLPDPKTRVLE